MGDILVFLTGQDDIEAAVQLLNEEAQSFDKSTGGRPLTSLNYFSLSHLLEACLKNMLLRILQLVLLIF